MVLLTMTASILLFLITSAMSMSWDSSRSGAIFKTILGFLDVSADGCKLSRAVTTPSRRRSRRSLFCRPLCDSDETHGACTMKSGLTVNQGCWDLRY